MPLINIICWFTSSINPLFNFNRRFNFHIQSYSIFHLFWSFYFFPHQPTMCVEWEFCRMKWKMCVWLAREENKFLGWTSKMVTTFNAMHFEKISWIINFLKLLSLLNAGCAIYENDRQKSFLFVCIFGEKYQWKHAGVWKQWFWIEETVHVPCSFWC